jgi:pyrroline-5-carboxylate reductase
MKTLSIGFIGAGRVSRIMLAGWERAGLVPDRVLVYDKDAAVAGKLAASHRGRVEVCETLAGAAGADVVFLAVHPPIIMETLAAIRASLRPASLLVSLAPKLTLAAMGDALGGHAHLARVNPSAPGIIGRGLNPYALGAGATAADEASLKSLFEPLGSTRAVDERKLEAYAIISAMGPTYFWFQLEQLRSLAVDFGMDGAEAAETIELMIQGAARTLFGSGLSPDEVMDLVPVKPLGTSEASIRASYQDSLAAVFARIKA